MDRYPTWFTKAGLSTEEAVIARIRKTVFDGITSAVDDGVTGFVFFVDKRYLLQVMDELVLGFPGCCFVDTTDDCSVYRHYEAYRSEATTFHYIRNAVPCYIKLDHHD